MWPRADAACHDAADRHRGGTITCTRTCSSRCASRRPRSPTASCGPRTPPGCGEQRRPHHVPRGAGPRRRRPLHLRDRRRAPHVPVASRSADGVRPVLRAGSSTALHPHGMKVFQQLWHGGSAAAPPAGRVPNWSASDVPNPMVGVVPTPMTQGDDRRRRRPPSRRRPAGPGRRPRRGRGPCRPWLPRRPVPVAGHQPPRRRVRRARSSTAMRFLRDILVAIRAEVGPDFPVGVRPRPDEEVEGGLRADDSAEIARLVEPLVDFVDVSIGELLPLLQAALDHGRPARLRDADERGRDPRGGRPDDRDRAHHDAGPRQRTWSSGTADMVSMVRALIADPTWWTRFATAAPTRCGRASASRPQNPSARTAAERRCR